jgi:hypothetical protein
MSDLFDRIVARALDDRLEVRPKLRSPFESLVAAPLESEIIVERDTRGGPAPPREHSSATVASRPGGVATPAGAREPGDVSPGPPERPRQERPSPPFRPLQPQAPEPVVRSVLAREETSGPRVSVRPAASPARQASSHMSDGDRGRQPAAASAPPDDRQARVAHEPDRHQVPVPPEAERRLAVLQPEPGARTTTPPGRATPPARAHRRAGARDNRRDDPELHVHIGRLEIRAIVPDVPPARSPAAPRKAGRTLDDYLRSNETERR